MRTALKIFALCVIAAVVAAITTFIFHAWRVTPTPGATDITYADFLSISLTALSLLITVLGLFVAALGVIGWTSIESKLKAHSVEYFAKQLEKDGPLRRDLEQIFADIAYRGVEGLKGPPPEEGPYTD